MITDQILSINNLKTVNAEICKEVIVQVERKRDIFSKRSSEILMETDIVQPIEKIILGKNK